MGHGCCGPEYGRRYLTKEEKIRKLEECREFLESEAKGVRERIKELKEEYISSVFYFFNRLHFIAQF